jgi:hypothetical protein
MDNQEWRVLSNDLTNCLAQRNAELDSAKHVIGALLVALAVPQADRKRAQKKGTEWLKNYNDRVYRRAERLESL